MGHTPGSKIPSSRKRGAKSPPPPLSRLCHDGDGVWGTGHRPQGSKDRLRCPLLRVSEQQWEWDPGLEGR